jgi:Leucine-rich repeat
MEAYSRKKEPSVISSRVILDGIEDADAEAMKSSLPEHDIIRRATTVSLSYKSEFCVANDGQTETRNAENRPCCCFISSFVDLLKIENLQLLQNVRTLRLDNNMITKIEGLSHLKNLTWLDLSFNRIRKIEGLDKLENLTDLSLYNNEIKTIAGLENLANLQCLSIGNNQIEQLEQILYLKRLPKLDVLVLDGNPIARSKMQQYRSFCLAFLPQLKYLDYALVLPADVSRSLPFLLTLGLPSCVVLFFTMRPHSSLLPDRRRKGERCDPRLDGRCRGQRAATKEGEGGY